MLPEEEGGRILKYLGITHVEMAVLRDTYRNFRTFKSLGAPVARKGRGVDMGTGASQIARLLLHLYLPEW